MGREIGLDRKQYKRYILSTKWQDKKRNYLRSKLPKQCYICFLPYNKTFHFHHRTYNRLGKEISGLDIVPVCLNCHNDIHIFQKKFDFSVWMATKQLKKISNKIYKKNKNSSIDKIIIKIRNRIQQRLFEPKYSSKKLEKVNNYIGKTEIKNTKRLQEKFRTGINERFK